MFESLATEGMGENYRVFMIPESLVLLESYLSIVELEFRFSDHLFK